MFINLVKACSTIVAGSPAVSCNLDYVIFIDIHYSDADTRVRLACFRVSGVSEQRLESIGWSAITVWECELSKSGIENTMEKIESLLAENRTKWEKYQAHRRESRKFAIEQAHRRRELNAIIEAELNERFGIPEKIRRLSRIDEDLS